MEDFRCDISWCATTLHHQLVRSDDLRKSEISDFDLDNFFSAGVFLDKDVLWLQISVHDSACLQVLYCFDDLVHNQRDFSLVQLVCFDVLEQLTPFYLLHYYKHVLLCLVGFAHRNDVWVRN